MWIKMLQLRPILARQCVMRLIEPPFSFVSTLPVGPIRQQVNIRNLTSLVNRNDSDSGIIKSKYADVQIPTNMSLPQYLMSDFDKYGDQVALDDGLSGKCYTYRQLNDLVRRCGSGLVKHGFIPGDVCLLCKPNSPDYFISYMSVLSVGGVVTTTNPLCSADELMRYLSASDASWVICAPDCVEKIQEAVAHVTRVKDIFVMGNESVGGCTLFTKLIGDDGSAFPSDLKVNPKQDVAALLFSSGTTGPPKGVMLTHYNVIASVHLQSFPGFLKFESGVDIIPAIIPFFHVAGLVGVLSLGLKQGIRLITLPKFEPETFLRTIQEYKATRILTVPPLVFFLANHPLVDRYDLSSVSDIICGGAPTGPAIIKAVRKRLGQSNIPVREVFGMTELSSLTTIVTTDEEFEIGSVGTLLPNTTAKVIDLETGKTLGVGKEGEICFRGPQVMKGYRNNIEETRKMISEDGWLRTGS